MSKQMGYALEHIAFEGSAASRSKSMPSRHGDESAATRQESLHPFAAWALEASGLSADAYHAAPMRRRLASCLRSLKVASLSEAWSLTQDPGAAAKVIDSLMIGVTEFFRDPAVFESLREILAVKPGFQQEPIRVWSAGCSNGAELYSIAMLLAETGLMDRSILVGTDCRESAIQEAQAGLFGEAALQSLDIPLRLKYMEKAGAQWRIADTLNGRIRWRVSNLLSGCEKGPWDIILWRNMAIYLRMETALRVWHALIKEMRPGGLLIVGKAEKPPASANLKYLRRSIYQLQ